MVIPQEVSSFFHVQNYTVISTIDKNGFPHNSCKGIVQIEPRKGIIYLLDLYMKDTYANLKKNARISVTAVDEHKFKGYSLKGRARIVSAKIFGPKVLKAWEETIATRITQRVLRNLREEKGHPHHPEAQLPKPAYLIAIKVNEIIDLKPPHIIGGV